MSKFLSVIYFSLFCAIISFKTFHCIDETRYRYCEKIVTFINKHKQNTVQTCNIPWHLKFTICFLLKAGKTILAKTIRENKKKKIELSFHFHTCDVSSEKLGLYKNILKRTQCWNNQMTSVIEM